MPSFFRLQTIKSLMVKKAKQLAFENFLWMFVKQQAQKTFFFFSICKQKPNGYKEHNNGCIYLPTKT